jgi:hypothetical protein
MAWWILTAAYGASTPPTSPAPSHPSSSPAGAALGPASAPRLSPDAAPFYPGQPSGGRTKSCRWADDDSEETDDDQPRTYIDAVLHHASPASAPPPRAQSRPAADKGQAGVDDGRLGHGRRLAARRRPRPQLVHGLPARPVDGHAPVRQRLGRRGRVSTPDADGWREILQRQESRAAAASSVK